MATQTVEFRSPPSQTITAKLFAVGSDTQAASVSSTEATNRKGTYSAAYTDVAAGEYELIALVGSVPVARWFVTLTLTTATFQAYDKSRAELDSSVAAQINAIETFAVRMTTAISQDGLVWQFTTNALENAPSATGVDELQATQEEILELIDTYITGVTAAAQDTPGTIAGFPSTLNIGDSYTDALNNAITVTLVDDEDNPVDTWGEYDVNHAGFTPALVISGSGGKVTATVTYDTDHFLVEIPSSESLRASPGTATMQFVLKWFVDGRLVAQKTIVSGQAVTWVKQI